MIFTVFLLFGCMCSICFYLSSTSIESSESVCLHYFTLFSFVVQIGIVIPVAGVSFAFALHMNLL
jgi:hypothetical protein